MTLTTETRIETENANRYLDALCRQLDARSHAKPEVDVQVSWTDDAGTVDFGWGRCIMRASETTLELHADAPDENGLQQVRELITRHLEKLAGDGELALTWHRDGAPISDRQADRRDAMRGFHRRMRH
jgi:hypothetical protein